MSVLLDRLPTDPLEALRELTRTEAELGELRRQFVADARTAGVSWDQIGESLGMTRQSAWEYFGRPARKSIASQNRGNQDQLGSMGMQHQNCPWRTDPTKSHPASPGPTGFLWARHVCTRWDRVQTAGPRRRRRIDMKQGRTDKLDWADSGVRSAARTD